VAGLTIVCG